MSRSVAVAGLLFLSLLAAGCGAGYGKKLEFKGGEVYYTANVMEAEAKKLGEYLESVGQFKEGRKSSIQLDSADGVYLVRMVVVDNFKEMKEYPGVYHLLGARISAKVFDDKPVAIQFTDNRLKTIDVLEAKHIGSLIAYDKSEIVYSHGVTKDEAKLVGDYLKKTKYFDASPATVNLRKQGETYQVRFVVDSDKLKKQPVLKTFFQLRGAAISTAVLKGNTVEVHLTDAVLKTVEVLKPLTSKPPSGKTSGTSSTTKN